ncbi:MAG: peptide chain release factor N(5)-glutamine methyltransferase [Candidatus Scatovivens sp.]
MNIKEALDFGKKYLNEKNIKDSNLKCRLLLSSILNVQKEYLIIHDAEELNKKQEIKYKEFIIRLADNEPIQYIIHNQEFMKLKFYVDDSVLIPQPDTEILVEKIIEISKKINQKIKILDLCTGSGTIAVSLAKYIEKCEVYATDISKQALKIAKLNSDKNNVSIKIIESDLFENIEEKEFDIIVSNPPYIETKKIDTLDDEVKKEPRIALDGGNDGLNFYRLIAINAKKYLNKNGILALEIGYNQKNSVNKILKNEGYKQIENIKDLGNNDRVIICRR